MLSHYVFDTLVCFCERYLATNCFVRFQKDDQNALSELHYDTWEIFRKYVHEGAQHIVSLPDDIFRDFRRAVEERDTELLDKALEKVEMPTVAVFVLLFCC